MNILHINTYDSGGAANSAIRLHKGLLKLGVNSHMLNLLKSNNQIPQNAYYYGVGKSKFSKIVYKLHLQPDKAARNKQLLSKATSGEVFSFATSDFDITTHPLYKTADIINLHWVAGFLDYPSFFEKNTKPVVWTLHDQFAFTGLCHYSGNCIQYQSKCTHCPLLQGTYVEKSFNIKAKAIQGVSNIHIVSPSKWLKETSEQSFLFKGFQHSLIPYGLDLNIFKPIDKKFAREFFNLPPDIPVFLFVSDNLSTKRKGFDILLKAIDGLSSDNLFCAVGYTEKQTNNVLSMGRIYDERLLAILYSAADAFILPSLEDNLPNTIVEAMACGTPVIGFNTGGVPDLVQTGLTGILSHDTTPEALRISIEEITGGKYNFSTKVIREFALQNLSESKQALAYQKLYDSISNYALS